MGPGGSRGLQIRRRRGSAGMGGFDSHTLPPCSPGPTQKPFPRRRRKSVTRPSAGHRGSAIRVGPRICTTARAPRVGLGRRSKGLVGGLAGRRRRRCRGGRRRCRWSGLLQFEDESGGSTKDGNRRVVRSRRGDGRRFFAVVPGCFRLPAAAGGRPGDDCQKSQRERHTTRSTSQLHEASAQTPSQSSRALILIAHVLRRGRAVPLS